ncbi:MAG: SHOCT domain-containing protein [Candidatus Bipolaricaulia bacterium]
MMWDGGSMWWMWLWPLLFIALIGGIVYAVVRGATQTQTRPPTQGETGDEAMEILRRQYARGEIDEEEFEQRRRVLADNR